ncbi:MAG: DUF1501 domain-containing protein [Gemmataceae bacterium]|nr:DUF1501 domain-containing protein [Gemmataceae bacterium]
MSETRIVTRRELLQGLGVIGIGAALPQFLVRTALAGPQAQPGQKALVVLQLSGGHDGLSAVVPYRNDHYARYRTATRLTANAVLRVNDDIGLHPNLRGFKDLLDQRALGIVQGVGYPNPNRSHFRSMDIWHNAENTNRSVPGGWIGRYCDHAFRGVQDPALSLAIGGDKVPRAIQGREHPGLSLHQLEAYRFLATRSNPRLGQAYSRINQATQGSEETLSFIERTSVNANASSEAIQRIIGQRSSGATYPATQLGNALRTVGALLRGGLSTRVYYVFQGGYDTHRGQKVRHDRLMTDLGEAMVAFQRDLAQQGNAQRVLTMAFSEFGRRARENGSQGTDHGTAGPMFLFGPGVRAGLHGRHPSLAPADLVNGDMRYQVDFRSVYATVLQRWLNTPSVPVLGQQFPLLDCLA